MDNPDNVMNRECPACGKPLEEIEDNCPKCGHPLDDVAESEQFESSATDSGTTAAETKERAENEGRVEERNDEPASSDASNLAHSQLNESLSFEEVKRVLASTGNLNLFEKFRNERITDDVIHDLSEEDLQEIGVDKLGDRRRLLRQIEQHGPRDQEEDDSDEGRLSADEGESNQSDVSPIAEDFYSNGETAGTKNNGDLGIEDFDYKSGGPGAQILSGILWVAGAMVASAIAYMIYLEIAEDNYEDMMDEAVEAHDQMMDNAQDHQEEFMRDYDRNY